MEINYVHVAQVVQVTGSSALMMINPYPANVEKIVNS